MRLKIIDGKVSIKKDVALSMGLPKVSGDPYLYVGSNLAVIGEALRELGYTSEMPTKYHTDLTKAKRKGQRSISKKLVLSGSYGAGAFRIWRDLVMQGVDIVIESCKKMHKDYWDLFSGVVEFTDSLKKETDEVGYFIDGIGTPVTVDSRFERDTLNRCIQRTGHMILVKYLYHIEQIRKESGTCMYPILDDLHDETIWEFHEEDESKVMQVFEEAWIRTNDELGGIIPLSGAPEVCTSWADFKCEEPRGIL